MSDDVILGTRDAWGEEMPFRLSRPDRRQHLYVIGKSGTGKTTLLRNLIIQDIEAGRGVAVIDPHGDLATDLLDLIPRSRTDDVVYFDPADAEHPIGLNLVGVISQERRHLAASGIVSALKGIWADSWGPRLEYVLYAAVSAVLDCQNVSLLAVQRMLSDEKYRAWVVKQVKDPMVLAFWEREFASWGKRMASEIVAPIQNKLGALLMSPLLRNVLGQVKSKIDVRSLIDRGHIFVANLSKGRLGENESALIGALLMTQFQLAAMARADVQEADRRDFFLYVDEFQSFASDSFSSMLSEARKYRLSLTLSHQYSTQLKPEIADAVVGNVGSIVAFRVGHQDAEALEKAFGRAYAANSFTSLSNGEVYAKILSDGQDIEPFMGRTMPPQGRFYNRGETILMRSRQKYAVSRDKIERKITQWLTIRTDRKLPRK